VDSVVGDVVADGVRVAHRRDLDVGTAVGAAVGDVVADGVGGGRWLGWAGKKRPAVRD
jgi:hypothetical protein